MQILQCWGLVTKSVALASGTPASQVKQTNVDVLVTLQLGLPVESFLNPNNEPLGKESAPTT